MNVKIIIATHKKTDLPIDHLYLPIHVGKEGKDNIGYEGDDTGDNISFKNPYYSELTAVYWAWKNLDADYIGLVHYRRYFSYKRKKKNGNLFNDLLTTSEAEKLLSKADVILPKKRKYYIESLFSHYSNTHDENHLAETRKIIQERCPAYLESFDKIMRKTSGHMFNMFIMKKNIMNEYCSWLFPILFDLEKKVDYKNLSPYDARLFGRVSELLLNVWIDNNRINYQSVGYIHFGKIDWSRKIYSFLFAKLTNKKYSKSF